MKRSLFSILIVLSLLLAACSQQPAAKTSAVTGQEPSQANQAPKVGVTLVSAPTSVKAGEQFQISWRVEGNPKTIISHTVIHYDNISHPGSFGLDVQPPQVGYKTFTTESATGEYYLPSTFISKIKAGGVGKIYYRAYAIIDGENYWSPEYSIDVVSATTPSDSASTVQSYSVNANDATADPKSLTVAKGSKFIIKFNVADNVYYGGLRFLSDKFTSPTVKPGTTWATPELTADENFGVTAYWPVQDVKKWTLVVNVS